VKDDQLDKDSATPGTLEHTDMKESVRQLWWTVGVTAVGLVVLTYLYF
jgi:hypothetical protein